MKTLQRSCFAVALILLVCTPALADPALWTIKSPTATIYLFGTVHVLPKDMRWHYPALGDALSASDKLYVEEDDDDPLTMQMLVMKYGMDLQHPLSDRLDATDRARLDSAAKDSGVMGGAATLDAMKPWLAALTIAVAPIVKAGYDPKSGADKQLERAFKAAGKPVGAFESAEEQIRFFAELPDSLQMDLLCNALDEYAEGPQQVKALIEDWQAGDTTAIAKVVNGGMQKHYPDLYKVLLVDRNRNWAKQIVALLNQHATIFVAVGAGHLAGADSVQAQLAKLGIASERVH
ncbi:MAG TPA: TraB/GumN family protein [Rhodanobacteraceae bacterium]|nr:TraB/GumN family protein [Rhodanobacteraceae bacterium]